MRTSDLFFIIIIMVACSAGGIAMIASHSQNSNQVTDTFGNAPTEQTNKTMEMVTTVEVTQANYTGYFLLFGAVVLVIMIIIGGMILIKKGKIGGGKYRTG